MVETMKMRMERVPLYRWWRRAIVGNVDHCVATADEIRSGRQDPNLPILADVRSGWEYSSAYRDGACSFEQASTEALSDGADGRGAIHDLSPCAACLRQTDDRLTVTIVCAHDQWIRRFRY